MRDAATRRTRRGSCTSRSKASRSARGWRERKLDAGSEHKRLETRQRVARVGVDRGERAFVARVHRLEHVHGLGATNLTHDDAVGAHTQELRTSSRMRISPVPSMFAGRDSSVITWSCWS